MSYGNNKTLTVSETGIQTFPDVRTHKHFLYIPYQYYKVWIQELSPTQFFI